MINLSLKDLAKAMSTAATRNIRITHAMMAGRVGGSKCLCCGASAEVKPRYVFDQNVQYDINMVRVCTVCSDMVATHGVPAFSFTDNARNVVVSGNVVLITIA